ncbi:MAG: DUF5004 domain-containing protein [Bacteroidia bacterium]
MKHIIWIMLIAVISVVSSCKPEVEDIGPAYAAGEGIYGSWEIESVKQVDLTQPIPESKDISSYFNSDPSRKMQLRFDQENNVYAVPQLGVLPRTFATGGTWRFDTIPFPTQLTFITEANDTIITPIRNMPREIDRYFGFDVTRTDSCGTAYIRYEYNFKRLN